MKSKFRSEIYAESRHRLVTVYVNKIIVPSATSLATVQYLFGLIILIQTKTLVAVNYFKSFLKREIY